jgi:glycosyltransferase involved in cell wall biosynthesis
LISRKYISVPALLEMQGMKKAIAKHITADLTVKELFQCIWVKEILIRSIIISNQKQFAKWGRFEEEIILGHNFIDVQSEWMSANVKSINPKANRFYVDLALRKSFYSAQPWSEFESKRNINGSLHNIFFSSSGSIPYKGIHIAIRSLAILKKKYPKARLRIAGNIQIQGFRQDGYMHWLNHIIKTLNLFDNIDWLGALNADQIIHELQHCGVNVVCSFVESYCLALAEPMYLGVPSVTSFTGGTSWIAKDNTHALFYTPGDEMMCAHQINRIFSESDLRYKLSFSAREAGLKRHDIKRIAQEQYEIYKNVIGDILI